jgi:hypothetical protein
MVDTALLALIALTAGSAIGMGRASQKMRGNTVEDALPDCPQDIPVAIL